MTEPNQHWLDKLPFPHLFIAALLLGLAPFATEPHLIEKIRMLFDGNLSRPIDIFDLFMHGAPIILIALKAVRTFILKPKSEN
ncbi:MAG: hypothetical protein DWQ05_20455 [Calditrichaeota bacterium]|nr:MAG: hypothetical protein DWQ05_20455 [Calditrichota bacterium]